jgi:hypothetical protein
MKPVPDNIEIAWRQLDEMKLEDAEELIISILGQVNDVLAHKESKLYFAIVPSTQDGLEICWFER